MINNPLIRQLGLILIVVLSFQPKMSSAQDRVSASFWFPMNSGLALINFHVFEIKDTTLFELEAKRQLYWDWDSTHPENYPPYLFDTLAQYPVTRTQQKALIEVLNATDSFGHHSALGCVFIMGWPRFIIKAQINDRQLDGYIANCYRAHIFRVVDVFNKIYPKGDMLTYNMNDLLKLEVDCNKRWQYGDDSKKN